MSRANELKAWLLAALVGVGGTSLSAPTQAEFCKHPAPAGANSDVAALERGLAQLTKAVAEGERFLQQSPAFDDEYQRVRAYEHLLRVAKSAIDNRVLQDRNYPFFIFLDWWSRMGGDNPDQRYYLSTLAGDGTYRIWGNRGGSYSLQFQLAEQGDSERSVLQRTILSSADLDALGVTKGEDFEVFISAEEHPGHWIGNRGAETALVVREIFSDWRQQPASVHIDRIDCKSVPSRPKSYGALAAQLQRAADYIRIQARDMPQYIQQSWGSADQRNTLRFAGNPSAEGGMVGRYMSNGVFDLAEDEALLITTWPVADYQGVQLTDMWMASLDYANNQSSLNNSQAYLGADGMYQYVIASSDPGVKNWLDTVGLHQGAVLLRFDGTYGGQFPEDKKPHARKVKLSELKGRLAEDEWLDSPRQRKEALAERRRFIQQREGF